MDLSPFKTNFDVNLFFSLKILPPGTLKPQDKHLQTRVEYLIKILKQAAIEDKAEQLRKVSNLVERSLCLATLVCDHSNESY